MQISISNNVPITLALYPGHMDIYIIAARVIIMLTFAPVSLNLIPTHQLTLKKKKRIIMCTAVERTASSLQKTNGCRIGAERA